MHNIGLTLHAKNSNGSRQITRDSSARPSTLAEAAAFNAAADTFTLAFLLYTERIPRLLALMLRWNEMEVRSSGAADDSGSSYR